MKIRKAEKKDIPRILELLGQVLQIHAEIRPDIFIPGTTKYTLCELTEIFFQNHSSMLEIKHTGRISHTTILAETNIKCYGRRLKC